MMTGTRRANFLPMRPAVGVGIGAWLLYATLTYAIQSSAGIPYAEWFKTAENAWRTGVLSLLAGSVLLLAFVIFTPWKHLWRDPIRLQSSPLMKVAMILWWVAIAIRLFGVKWNEVPNDLLLAIVTSGILVGFAEETLFRGIFLRCMREGGRPEAAAAIWTAIGFGLFHLPNVFMGTGAIGAIQVVLATLSGSILYVFRRHYGVLWPAMLAHGAWDISAFLAGSFSTHWLAAPSLLMQLVFVILGIAVFASLMRNDRQTIAIPITRKL